MAPGAAPRRPAAPAGLTSPADAALEPMTLIAESELPPAVARQLELAFAPLHKRAFGMAVGTAAALLVFGMTAVYLLRNPGPELNFRLDLLAAYFTGYSVSWGGAVVGAAWGFVTGFVAGWFIAFCRNLVIAASVFLLRTRAELEQTRDILDHI